MKIEVCERYREEDVEKLLSAGDEQCRPKLREGAWCRFRGDLVEGVAWIVSRRLTHDQPEFARDQSIAVAKIVGGMSSVDDLRSDSCAISVETDQEDVRDFRKLAAASTPLYAMGYLSLPGRFRVRGRVACVTRTEDGAAQVADIMVGDAFFSVDSDDVGSEDELSALAEGDAVEFEVRCLSLYDADY
jgi:hypothetical protein